MGRDGLHEMLGGLVWTLDATRPDRQPIAHRLCRCSARFLEKHPKALSC